MTLEAQMDAVTNDYFMIDGGKAEDIYFETSYLLNYGLKQQKGIWKRPGGGRKVKIPLRYDGNETGFYGRGDTLSSDKREAITAAYFLIKHAYGNGTVLRIDTLENSGPEAMIDLVTEEVAGAQASIRKTLASSIYDNPSGVSDRLTGLRAMCNESTSLEYGELTEAEVIAQDGTTPWEGKMDSTSEPVSLDGIRTLRTDADGGQGTQDEPDLVVTSKTLFNTIKSILQVQQMFTTEGSKVVKAGFTGVYFEGADIFPDRYIPAATYMFALNSSHWGWAVHKKGYFMRTPWSIIEGSAQDRTFKILFDGNQVCNNRKVHKGHSGLTA
jgi:hypothetical protein